MLRRPTSSLPRRCGRRRLQRARSWGSDAGRRRRAGWRQALSRQRPRALPACQQRLPGRVGVALHPQHLQVPPPLLPPHLVALVHVVLVDEHLHPLLDLTTITPSTVNYYCCCCTLSFIKLSQNLTATASTEGRKRECCGGELHLYIERFTQIQVLLTMEVTVSRFCL